MALRGLSRAPRVLAWLAGALWVTGSSSLSLDFRCVAFAADGDTPALTAGAFPVITPITPYLI
jgi:hypothetical protein